MSMMFVAINISDMQKLILSSTYATRVAMTVLTTMHASLQLQLICDMPILLLPLIIRTWVLNYSVLV
jgi:hypothetical protein